VHLPIFTLKGEDEQSDDMALLGLSGGGQAILNAREKFTKFLKILVTIASLQTQFVTIDRALKVTNRRVNALEFVLIPRIANTIAYIKDELDEEAREDFTRLKKVTDAKKERKKEEFDAMEKAQGSSKE
jgi:V-type H+-transporting ATPase subunit D